MTTIAVIQVRMNSSRFPGKVLYDLAGKPVLKHVIDRVRMAESVDRIIVATAGKLADDIIGHCEVWGVDWYLGPVGEENDVLGRFVGALKNAESNDVSIRVCADNPLIVPSTIDALTVIRAARQAHYAGYRIRDGNYDGTPAILHGLGWFAEVASVAALRHLNVSLSVTDPRREHVTQGLYQQPRTYRCAWLEAPNWYWHEHCPSGVAIDTPEDLKRVAELLEDWEGECPIV